MPWRITPQGAQCQLMSLLLRQRLRRHSRSPSSSKRLPRLPPVFRLPSWEGAGEDEGGEAGGGDEGGPRLGPPARPPL